MVKDKFTGKPLVPSQCCGAGIITASLGDKTWPVCSGCGEPIGNRGPNEPTDEAVIFTNVAPENKQWTSHIKLLNDWTPADVQLRHIYARSGPYFPADMHVNLIEQYHEARMRQMLQRIKDAGPDDTSMQKGEGAMTINSIHTIQNDRNATWRQVIDEELAALGLRLNNKELQNNGPTE